MKTFLKVSIYILIFFFIQIKFNYKNQNQSRVVLTQLHIFTMTEDIQSWTDQAQK